MPQAKKMIIDSIDGQEALAEKILIECIRENPRDVEPIIELSKLIEKQISTGERPIFEIHKSLALISQAFDLESNNPKIRFLMAHMLNEVGHYEDSQILYKKTIELFPNNRDTFLEKSKEFIESNPDKALELVKSSIASGLNVDDALDVILSSIRFKSNLNTYSQVLSDTASEFQNRWLFHKLGLVYVEEKKYFEAAKAFENAIKLGNEFESKLQLAIVQYLYLNQAKKSISNFRELISQLNEKESASSLSLVYSHYSLALFLDHQFSQASQAALEVAKLNSENHEVIQSLVYEFKARNALEILSPMLKLMIENDPGFSLAYAFLAEIEKKKKQYILAKKHLEDAVILDPKNDSYYAMLGSVYSSELNFDKALSFYNLALELNPSNSLYIYNKACSLAMLGKKKEALYFLKIVFTSDSDFIELAKNDKDFSSIKSDSKFAKEFANLIVQNYDGKWASTDNNFKTRP